MTNIGDELTLSPTVRISAQGDRILRIDQSTGSQWLERILLGSATLVRTATAFPSSPTTGDLLYRSDRAMEFYYDGTRWLSSTFYQMPVTEMQETLMPWAATPGGMWSATPSLMGGSDIWMINLESWFYVGAGTALAAGHKWVGLFRKLPSAGAGGSAVTITTINIDSGASDSMRQSILSINALLNNGTTHFGYTMAWTKTGTPGTLRSASVLTYRVVG